MFKGYWYLNHLTIACAMHCRSEARKMEQKDLVMEGGVVGVGINLVRLLLFALCFEQLQ